MTSFQLSLNRFSKAIGLISIICGLSVIFGWLLNIQILKSIYPTWVTMKFNTALCFVLAGCSLIAFTTNHKLRWAQHSVNSNFFCALVFGGIAFLTLLEYWFAVNFGIDELVVRDKDKIFTSAPGRMAPNTAISFFLLSFGFILAKLKRKVANRLAQVFVASVLIVCITAVIGYIYRIFSFYGVGAYTTMAFHTA